MRRVYDRLKTVLKTFNKTGILRMKPNNKWWAYDYILLLFFFSNKANIQLHLNICPMWNVPPKKVIVIRKNWWVVDGNNFKLERITRKVNDFVVYQRATHLKIQLLRYWTHKKG